MALRYRNKLNLTGIVYIYSYDKFVMYLKLNATLILIMNVLLFVIAAVLLNFLKCGTQVNHFFNKKTYNVYILLLLWLLTALPVTSVFLIKTNVVLANIFSNFYISLIFFLLNTQILLVYYRYYVSLIKPSYSVKYPVVSLKQLYRDIWLVNTTLLMLYTVSYFVLILV